MSSIQLFYRKNYLTLSKTFTYYLLHITVAASVGYVITGSWSTAMALSLIEPTVQAFAFFAHEKVWQRYL